jgi:sensor c-di-GMP phosphodiesterase-like protein
VAKAKRYELSLKQLAEANCNRLKIDKHFLAAVGDKNESSIIRCRQL